VPLWAGGRVTTAVALSCVSPHQGSALRLGEAEETVADLGHYTSPSELDHFLHVTWNPGDVGEDFTLGHCIQL